MILLSRDVSAVFLALSVVNLDPTNLVDYMTFELVAPDQFYAGLVAEPDGGVIPDIHTRNVRRPPETEEDVRNRIIEMFGGLARPVDVGRHLSFLIRSEYRLQRRNHIKDWNAFYENARVTRRNTQYRDYYYQLLCCECFRRIPFAGPVQEPIRQRRWDDINLVVLFGAIYNKALPLGGRPLSPGANRDLWDHCQENIEFNEHVRTEEDVLESAMELLDVVETEMMRRNNDTTPVYRRPAWTPHVLSPQYMRVMEQEELAWDTLAVVAEP